MIVLMLLSQIRDGQTCDSNAKVADSDRRWSDW